MNHEIVELVAHPALPQPSPVVPLTPDRPPLPPVHPLQFPYAEAVFKEVMRLHPPVPMLAREAGPGAAVAGRPVPPGTWLHVSLVNLHRDPRYWRDPDAFCPERFLPGAPQAAGNDLTAYMPWGEVRPQGGSLAGSLAAWAAHHLPGILAGWPVEIFVYR